MPRNRRPRERTEKREEIVHAAATLFTEVGFDDSSMAKIAAAAGVTPNTIYWYFDDKDSVLVAVLDLVLTDALQQAEASADQPWVELMLWAIDRLEQYSRLVTVVHARAATSPAIDAWHQSFHALMDSLLAQRLTASGVADEDVQAMTRTTVFVVEGLLMHPLDDQSRRDIFELMSRDR